MTNKRIKFLIGIAFAICCVGFFAYVVIKSNYFIGRSGRYGCSNEKVMRRGLLCSANENREGPFIRPKLIYEERYIYWAIDGNMLTIKKTIKDENVGVKEVLIEIPLDENKTGRLQVFDDQSFEKEVKLIVDDESRVSVEY